MGGRPLGSVIGRPPPVASSGEGGGTDDETMGDEVVVPKCMDVSFLVFFIVFWVAMIVNSSFGFNMGNPQRLTYGLDYKGNVCGDKHADPDLRELEIRYWMNPNQVYESGLKDSQFALANARSICLMECPTASEDGLNWVCDYPEGDIHISIDDWIDRDYDYYEFLTPEMRNSSLQLQGPCYPVIFSSVNVYWSCQYIVSSSNASLRHWQQMGGVSINENMLIDKAIHREINSRSSVLKRYVADIGKAWPVLIVCGGIVPLFLSLIWLLMIRHFVSGMTWITVILFNALIISVTMFYYAKAGWIAHDAVTPVIGEDDPYFSFSGREIGHLRTMAILMTIVMIISILSSIAIVRRILLAPSVLKVAANVIWEVQSLIVFPVFPYTLLAIFYMFWLSAAVHLFSSGRITKNDCNANCCSFNLKSNRVSCDACCGYSIHYTSHIAASILFHLFGCFWATQFVLACSATVIAGSVASYYWVRGTMSQEVPLLSVFASMKRLLRYNLGSVALGSLVVPIVESIRFIFESLRRRLKLVNIVDPVSRLEKTLFVFSSCLLTCIDWTLRSVNRSAYIEIAITGKGFCEASTLATNFIMNYILCVGKVNVIGDVVLFLGKLCVSLFCALFAFLMLDTYKYKSAHNRVSSPLFPVLVCWGLGYIVATLFFSVVEMSIDTLIISSCRDASENEGIPRYAPPLLMEIFDGPEMMQRLTQGS